MVPSSVGWVTYTFSAPRTLLRAPSGSAYRIYPLEGEIYGFRAAFTDGRLESSSNGGSSWSPVYSVDSDGMFYFTTM